MVDDDPPIGVLDKDLGWEPEPAAPLLGGQQSVANDHAGGVDKSRLLVMVPGIEFERDIVPSHRNSHK
ncbi:MAG: hypothetical protein ACKVIQ_11400 [Acidimicrobiales bacterium]